MPMRSQTRKGSQSLLEHPSSAFLGRYHAIACTAARPDSTWRIRAQEQRLKFAAAKCLLSMSLGAIPAIALAETSNPINTYEVVGPTPTGGTISYGYFSDPLIGCQVIPTGYVVFVQGQHIISFSGYPHPQSLYGCSWNITPPGDLAQWGWAFSQSRCIPGSWVQVGQSCTRRVPNPDANAGRQQCPKTSKPIVIGTGNKYLEEL